MYFQALEKRREALQRGQEKFLKALEETAQGTSSPSSSNSSGGRPRTVSESRPAEPQGKRQGRSRNYSEPQNPRIRSVVPPGRFRKQPNPQQKRYHSSSPDGGRAGRSKLARKTKQKGPAGGDDSDLAIVDSDEDDFAAPSETAAELEAYQQAMISKGISERR